MNPIIKREWTRRILSQKGTDPASRLSAEYILNKMYEEASGAVIRYMNTHSLKDKDGLVRMWISYSNRSPIDREVWKWAGLPCADPPLPSYPSIGGVVIPPSFQTLNGIQSMGMIIETETSRVGIGKVVVKNKPKRKINLDEIAHLINKDL